ncbi:MAG: hypothetical protein ABIS38_06195 [Sphingomicrobium sp.]
MTTRTPLAFALIAAAALAGCNQESHTIGPGAENAEADAPASPPVLLPPSISVSKIYRCADNRVVYVDWLSDNKSANIRTEQTGTPTQVTAAEAGGEMTAAGGYSLSGTSAASSAKVGTPGHAAQSCKA